jgi:asparagine synthase (glutamine-hydrolysing)
MCGIAGWFGRVPRDIPLGPTLLAMTTALAHRGPDDAGIWLDVEAGVGMGHRRLAIIDRSPAGYQPMPSGDGRLVISYNGEIYNAPELRAELMAAGHGFRGHSDTEVIVEGCAAWGVAACVARLIGMFAFALFDREQRTLTLVRDRVGIKPLYYGVWPGFLLFGSELKALRAHPGWTPEIDRDALAGYLRRGYVPAPHSIYRNVAKLEPGCILTIAKGSDARIHRYWDLRQIARQAAAEPLDLTPGAAVDRLESLLMDAVGRRMVADVPLGAFLSGGIDSSMVTALMQAQSSQPVRTFSIGFREVDYEEANHARAVADHLGTMHTELYVEPADALGLIPDLPERYDEPFADVSQVPTCLLAAMAREHVTVALSGDGGDELFAGYRNYATTLGILRWGRHLPPGLWRAVAGGIRSLPAAAWDRGLDALPAWIRTGVSGHRLHRAATAFPTLASGDAVFRQLKSLWPDPGAVVLGGHENQNILWDPSCADDVPDLVARMQLYDSLTYLPDDILTKVDRATMAVGLEARVPILDHRVVEFARGLPTTLHWHDGRGKWPLRQILARHLPGTLAERPKQGFGVPLCAWLRGPLRPWAAALLDAGRLAQEGYFAAAPIVAAWRRHLAGHHDESDKLWPVLMFQAWQERIGAAATAQTVTAATLGVTHRAQERLALVGRRSRARSARVVPVLAAMLPLVG